MTGTYKKIYGLPTAKGRYLTTHGCLYFDGKAFQVQLGSKKVYITIEWFMLPVKEIPMLSPPSIS